ncbi:MAG: hypothetical protein PVJ09_04820 [Candidatus Woesebacteria bacterium]|jgi:glutathione synthase/RimK-type ligase-like ATP-grasp enzyme
MKKIRIFSTRTDDYLKKFRIQAKLMNLKIEIYRYENFSFEDNKLTYIGRKKFPNFTKQDVVFFRRSAYEKIKQHFWLRLLATLARDAGAKVLNEDFMVNFPLHSGKLFQAAYFAAYNIPHISTYRLGRKIKTNHFPLLIKKRYTAFGRDSHLAKNSQELLAIKKKIKGLDSFVVQPFLDLGRDIRVVILDKKILGAVKRVVNVREDGHVGVKVTEKVKLRKAEIEIVKQVLNIFDLDFAGLDLFTSKTGKLWLGEINFFPNFESYIKISGENIFKLILSMMKNS